MSSMIVINSSSTHVSSIKNVKPYIIDVSLCPSLRYKIRSYLLVLFEVVSQLSHFFLGLLLGTESFLLNCHKVSLFKLEDDAIPSAVL